MLFTAHPNTFQFYDSVIKSACNPHSVLITDKFQFYNSAIKSS